MRFFQFILKLMCYLFLFWNTHEQFVPVMRPMFLVLNGSSAPFSVNRKLLLILSTAKVFGKVYFVTLLSLSLSLSFLLSLFISFVHIYIKYSYSYTDTEALIVSLQAAVSVYNFSTTVPQITDLKMFRMLTYSDLFGFRYGKILDSYNN